MSRANIVVAEFRERSPDEPPKGELPEMDADETTAVCDICGYWGIVEDDPEVTNADHPTSGKILACDECAERLETEEDSADVESDPKTVAEILSEIYPGTSEELKGNEERGLNE